WYSEYTTRFHNQGSEAVLADKQLKHAIITLLIEVVALGSAALTSYLLVTVDGSTSSFPPATTILKGFGALWLELAVWTAFGMFLGIAFRSTAAAIGGGLTYLFVGEALAAQLLRDTPVFKEILKFLPGVNGGAVNASFKLSFRSPNAATQLVDASRGSITLVIYLLLFTILALQIDHQGDRAAGRVDELRRQIGRAHV